MPIDSIQPTLVDAARWFHAVRVPVVGLACSIAWGQAVPRALASRADDPPPPIDRFVVRMPDAVATESGAEGELLLLFVPASRRDGTQPADGPWWSRPHPFGAATIRPRAGAAIEFRGSAPSTTPPSPEASPAGASVKPVDATGVRWYPNDPSTFEGAFRVQAVFRPHGVDPTPGGASEWRSEVVAVAMSPGRAEEVDLQLERSAARLFDVPTRLVGPGDPPGWLRIDEPSAMLASAGAEQARHRAWIVFPRGYHDLSAPRRMWPAIYVVPHEGDGSREAKALRDAIAMPEAQRSMPQAVWVVLDPTSPWGHHGFADSPVHGPRAAALVEEFVPTLEQRLRIVPDGRARLLSGHGAGGLSAIWLQQEFPRAFGGAFVTSPETVDLSRIGAVDAYASEAFLDEEGEPRAAYREAVAGRGEAIRTVVSQEARMAETASPQGRSGNRWQRWAARMSPFDESGRPRAIFTDDGRVDRSLAERWWLRYDLAAALAREPLRRVPMWDRSIQVRVGSLDEHFHDRTLLSLRSYLADLRRELGLPRPEGGLIELVPGATFDTIVPKATPATYRAMIERLRDAGLHDE